MPCQTSETWDTRRDMPDLTGKVAIVTGGNTGLGLEICRQLAMNNAKVYMASRTESRALGAIEKLQGEHPELNDKPGLFWLPIDLTDLASCRRAANIFLEKEERLDILINNAGIMAVPYSLTDDGLEIQFQSNYVGHFAFTVPLLPLLVQTSKQPGTSVRIVQVSSMGHDMATKAKDGIKFTSIEDVNRDFGSTWPRYGQSKLANILFAKEIARRYPNERIFSNALHPGNIHTELNRGTVQTYPWMKNLLWIFEKTIALTPYQGAITPLFAATAPEIETNNWRGEYFVPYAKKTTPSELARDEQLQKDLWILSEKIVEEKTRGKI